MIRELAGIGLYLLQEKMSYFKEDDPVQGFIVLGVIVVVVLIIVLVNRSKRSEAEKNAKKNKYGLLTMYRIANTYALNRDQVKLLVKIFKDDGVNDPVKELGNLSLVDEHFKPFYRQIETQGESADESQRQMALLFSLRNALEFSPNSPPAVPRLTENMAAVIAAGNETYPVRVLSSRGNNVVVEHPVNAAGTPVRLPRGTKLLLSFFTKSSDGFSFDCQAAGDADTPQGTGLQLIRAGQAKNLVQRRFRRRQITLPCVFYLIRVEITGSGSKKTKKMIVNKSGLTGNIMNISIGGCAIKTNSSVDAGKRLKITLNPPGSQSIAVLGQALRVNSSGAANATIHVKFIKVPRRAMNAINATVFEYAD